MAVQGGGGALARLFTLCPQNLSRLPRTLSPAARLFSVSPPAARAGGNSKKIKVQRQSRDTQNYRDYQNHKIFARQTAVDDRDARQHENRRHDDPSSILGDGGRFVPVITNTLSRIQPIPCVAEYYAQPNYYLTNSGIPVETLHTKFEDFRRDLISNAENGSDRTSKLPSKHRLFTRYKDGGDVALKSLLIETFKLYVGAKDANPDADIQDSKVEHATDLSFPQEWYPKARQVQRTWHLHVGPTNSGKTYHALKRLEKAGNGIYAGPLRLLAHEIYERMNAVGIKCNLLTGDDRRVSGGALVTSSTVEMAELNREVEVAVLDEIQMIGDPDRGWAWTQALMGMKAKEIHMCGEERTVDLIKKLAASVGDKLIVHNYTRLSPLEPMKESLGGDLSKIQKGDCVVSFSRRNIFAIKRVIEGQTKKRCAVVYGSLPPEVRSEQARLFNDPDSGFDVLVASNAVGMGLNLSIQRVIFEALEKFDGEAINPIPIPEVKQIAGRAGRYRVAVSKHNIMKDETMIPLPPASQIGYATTLEDHDLPALQYAMTAPVEPLTTAGILPTTGHIEQLASVFPPETKFSVILEKMKKKLRTSRLFTACKLDDMIQMAQNIDCVDKLSPAERHAFCMAPASMRDSSIKRVFVEMARCVAKSKDGSVLKLKSVDLEALDVGLVTDMTVLQRLESLHKVLILYLWLSYHFPATFTPRETAQELKTECEKQIEEGLKNVRFMRRKKTYYGRLFQEYDILRANTGPPKIRMVQSQSQSQSQPLSIASKMRLSMLTEKHPHKYPDRGGGSGRERAAV